MLTNGTETKGQEYKQINAAKKQKNQQGFGSLTELGGGDSNLELARQSTLERPRSQRKVMQTSKTYWFPKDIY